MPQVTVYVREEDLPKWKSIDKKSEFISNALRGVQTTVSVNPQKNTSTITTNPALDIPRVVKGSEFIPRPPDPETGYPCCQGKRPCKHWVWDGNQSAYTNSLTGKEREARI